MRKYFHYIFLAIFIFALAACGDSNEKAVKKFAKYFASLVEDNDTLEIHKLYPKSGPIKEVSIDDPDDFEILEKGGKKYKIKYGHGQYIIVKKSMDDDFEILESNGIIKEKEREQPQMVFDDVTPQPVETKAERPKPVVKHESKYGRKNYKGSIGPYKVKVSLNFSESGNIDGDYYYTRVGSKIFLSGHRNGNNFYLDEYTQKGHNSGYWDLYFDGNKIRGTFQNLSDGKMYSVTLNPS